MKIDLLGGATVAVAAWLVLLVTTALSLGVVLVARKVL